MPRMMTRIQVQAGTGIGLLTIIRGVSDMEFFEQQSQVIENYQTVRIAAPVALLVLQEPFTDTTSTAARAA